jgi:hypothetical protein
MIKLLSRNEQIKIAETGLYLQWNDWGYDEQSK